MEESNCWPIPTGRSILWLGIMAPAPLTAFANEMARFAWKDGKATEAAC
jgi:hypothetical protein